MTETNIASILVSILLLSVVAAGTPVSASTGVKHDGGGQHHEGYSYDANVTTGAVHWQGQELFFQGNSSDGQYDLYTVDDGTVGDFVRELALNDNGVAVIESTALNPTEYVIVDDSGQIVRTNDSGVQVGTTARDDSAGLAESTVTVAKQDLSVTADRDTVVFRERLDITLDSNRADYNVEITAEEFSSDRLQDIFGGTETDNGTNVAVGSTAIEADLSDVETGEYTFTFDATDTTAAGTETITVSEPDEMKLVEDTIRTAVGDKVAINLTLEPDDSGRLVVGSAEKAYRTTVGFEDVDGDGHVSLTLNSYLAGNHTGGGEARAWTADDGDDITDVNLTTAPLDEPLDPTNYEIAVRSGDGEEVDIGMLVLGEPSVSGPTLWTAPGSQFEDSLAEMTLTQTDQVALGDVVVAEIRAPGLFGVFDAQPGDDATERFQELVTSDNASLSASLQADNLGNLDPELDRSGSFENDAFHVMTDRANETLFVAMDVESLQMSDGRQSAQSGDSYSIAFRFEDGSGVISNGQTVVSTVEFTERTVRFDTGEDDRLRLPAIHNATVSGSTTVAPGTELDLRLRRNGTLQGVDTTVVSNRTFTVPVDLSNARTGTNVSVSVRGFEGTTQGVVGHSVTEPTTPVTPNTETTAPETPATETTAEATTSETTSVTTDTPERTTTTAAPANDDPPQSTSQVTAEEGPGFGFGVASIALAGFALLGMLRRAESRNQ